MLNLDDLWINDDRFDTPTEKLTDPIPVLFQSGYLTIKGYERRGKLYHLCFPNQEVRQGFSKSLVRYYTAQDMNRYDAIVYAYSKNVLINDDMGAFMPHLKAFYDKFPYTIINNNERHYQAVMFTIFTMLGEDVKVEHTTSDGRIDLVLKTDKSIFIFELKYEKSADTAMAQISGKDYATLFADAMRVTPFQSMIDPDAQCFANPADMQEAIRAYCQRTGQHVPEGYAEIIRCIFFVSRSNRRMLKQITNSSFREDHLNLSIESF